MAGITAKINEQLFLTGGGEMGDLIRAFDWNSTVLGDPEYWPAILKNFTALVLASPSPMLICWGNDYIQLYNDAFSPILGNTKHPQALGLCTAGTYAEIWPTLMPMFEQVMNGQSVSNSELKLKIERDGSMQDLYFNFSYNPVRDENGNIGGILVICLEITDQVNANRELDETQKNLHNLLNILTESDFKFRTLIKEAPVAIALLNGPGLVIEAANDHILEMWGKKPSIVGSKLADALPELAGQPYVGIMEEVIKNGKIYYGNENKAFLEHKGKLIGGYYNFICQPVKDDRGNTTRMMLVASNVTEQVNARVELETAFERTRLAQEAAQLGTFDLDLVSGTMDWDERCRELFGIYHQGKVTYENDFLNGLHPDDKYRVMKAINGVYNKAETDGNYDIEYRALGAEDNRLRWLKAKGKAYFDAQDKAVRFIGSVLDITEQKQDELRKNDFIGMVSHELKTPLTSLKAYIQLLNSKAKTGGDSFTATTLEKADVKIKTMEKMINGFLNISRLESGKLAIIRQEFDLNELLKEIIADVKLTSGSHEIVTHPCSPIIVSADRDKIGSVLINLLSNAIKYSPKGKIIDVVCKISDGNAIVSIKDQGMGIKAQDIDHLFDRYYRVESKHTAHISGFGIGLYLSSEIIKQHNGKIWVESTPGTGSVFSFSLPLEN